jgi:hypothetical protein
MDLRAGLDDLGKRKFFTLQGFELQPVASRYTDWAIPAYINITYVVRCQIFKIMSTNFEN